MIKNEKELQHHYNYWRERGLQDIGLVAFADKWKLMRRAMVSQLSRTESYWTVLKREDKELHDIVWANHRLASGPQKG